MFSFSACWLLSGFATVVGVVLNLAAWFALHTLFDEVAQYRSGPLLLDVPVWRSIEPAAAVLAVAAMIAMLRLKLGLGWTLLGNAVLGGSYWWFRAVQ